MSWWRHHYRTLSALRTHAPVLLRRSALVRTTVEVAGRKVPIFLRAGTSDLEVFDEVFRQGEYNLPLPPHQRIVDAGAHIGLASVVLACRFPQAQIVALEPEPGNFELLRRNTATLPNVRALPCGLWSRSSRLKVVDPGHSTWGFRVVETDDPAGIPAVGLQDVLAQLPGSGPLLLKMDIEGSEVEVLGASGPWQQAVDTLIVELHERFRPGCEAALAQFESAGRYARSVSGESVVLQRLP